LKKRAIGILGGSFNPAHEGHLYISNTALRSLGLDAVWWLVAPQNPLKPSSVLNDFDTRLIKAKKVASSPKIHVSDFERKQLVSYTAKTLKRLIRAYPDCNFVWLMGADNLTQIPKWYKWRDIFNTCPVAIFDRPGDTYRALGGEAAHLFASQRHFPSVWGKPLRQFAHLPCPAWTFVPHTKHKLSSTHIRKSAQMSGKACP
jgi:nicotinate-nucleotide adenylyltransferase